MFGVRNLDYRTCVYFTLLLYIDTHTQIGISTISR
jgi:hypothetical protein